jgi:hypothetical protein
MIATICHFLQIKNLDISEVRGAAKKPACRSVEQAYLIGRNLDQAIFDVTLNIISADRPFGFSPDLL